MPNGASFIQHSNKEEEEEKTKQKNKKQKQSTFEKRFQTNVHVNQQTNKKKEEKKKKQNSYQINKSHQQQYFHQTPSKMLYNDYKTRDGMYNRTTLIGHA